MFYKFPGLYLNRTKTICLALVIFDIYPPSDQITVYQRHRLDLHYLICQTTQTLKHCKLWLFHLTETNIWQGQPDMRTGNTADIFNGFMSWIRTARTAPQLGHTVRPSELTSWHTRRKGEATQISNVKMSIFPQQIFRYHTQLSVDYLVIVELNNKKICWSGQFGASHLEGIKHMVEKRWLQTIFRQCFMTSCRHKIFLHIPLVVLIIKKLLRTEWHSVFLSEATGNFVFGVQNKPLQSI